MSTTTAEMAPAGRKLEKKPVKFSNLLRRYRPALENAMVLIVFVQLVQD